MSVSLVIFGIICLLVMVGAGMVTNAVLKGPSTPAALTFSLSQPSKAILREYKALPKESQNIEGLESVLAAMDVKAGGKDNTRHFDDNWLPHIRTSIGTYSFNWKPYRQGCRHYDCQWAAHFRLHQSIQEISDSLEEKRKAIEMSKIQPDLDRVAEVEARLRDEITINREFTKTWKELS
jgi:hypothetical protein